MKEYTEEQKREFQKQYAIRFRRQVVSWIVLIVAILLTYLYFVFGVEKGNDVPDMQKVRDAFLLVFSIMFSAGVGVVIFAWFNWRCPACNSYLGKVFNPNFCPRCGAQFRDDKD